MHDRGPGSGRSTDTDTQKQSKAKQKKETLTHSPLRGKERSATESATQNQRLWGKLCSGCLLDDAFTHTVPHIVPCLSSIPVFVEVLSGEAMDVGGSSSDASDASDSGSEGWVECPSC